MQIDDLLVTDLPIGLRCSTRCMPGRGTGRSNASARRTRFAARPWRAKTCPAACCVSPPGVSMSRGSSFTCCGTSASTPTASGRRRLDLELAGARTAPRAADAAPRLDVLAVRRAALRHRRSRPDATRTASSGASTSSRPTSSCRRRLRGSSTRKGPNADRRDARRFRVAARIRPRWTRDPFVVFFEPPSLDTGSSTSSRCSR